MLTEVERGEKKWSVKAHKKGVNDIAWCHSQQWLASCGLGRAVLLWQVGISSPVFTLEGHQASVQSLRMHEASNTLISLDTDRVINIWDTRSLRCVQHINAEHQVDLLPFFPTLFFCSTRSGPSARVRLTATGPLINTIFTTQNPLCSLQARAGYCRKEGFSLASEDPHGRFRP